MSHAEKMKALEVACESADATIHADTATGRDRHDAREREIVAAMMHKKHRAHLLDALKSYALAHEIAEAAREFKSHEDAVQKHQDAGNLKDHVVKRLELLGELYALLARYFTEATDEND